MEQNPSRPVVLSRSVVITEESSIPSLLLLGKLVSDGAPDSASLRAKLLQNWGTSAMVNFWRVTDGTFLIQLQEKGDLTRVLDGAPWSCGGDGLFLVQHVKPDVNLVDQVAGFTKAELWVRFHHVPVDHCHPTSVHALAARIGEPVNCELSSSSFEFIRARIRVDITRPLERSVEVELENGKQARVSVEYEGISSSLCGSCGILGHPTNRCGRANQPAAAAPHPREKPPVYVASRLGSRRSTPAPSSPSLTEKSSSRQDDDPPVVETAPAPPEERSGQERLFFSGKGSCSNFLKLICLRMSTKELGEKKPCSTGDNLEDENQSVQTNSVHESVKEPSTMATQEAQLDTTLITRSHFSVTAQGSRSKKHARIEVIMETQCTPQLIMGAMQWISEKAEGLSASYDGKRGVISIFGLQIDQNTDPVDLIAYLFPKTGQKTEFEEGHKNLTAQQDLQTRWCVSMTRTAAKLRSRILEMRKRLASIEQERMGCDYKNTVQCCLIIQNWIIIFTQWR